MTSDEFRTAGRGDDKYIIRLVPGMRPAIKARAKANRRSMNSEVLSMIGSALKINDPATAPTVPGQGSNLTPDKDKKMNSTTDNTRKAGMPEAPTKVSWTKIGDVMDILATVRHLNEALFLAANGLGDRHHTNALQSVLDEINNKLLVADDRLEEIKEQLA